MPVLHSPSQPSRQKGVVLLVALVFLVLLTLLAVGASTSSLLQQHMVAATRNAQLADMSADTALRGAEWRIWSSTAAVGGYLTCPSGSISSDTGCVRYDPTSPLYAATGDVTKFLTSTQWLSGIGIVYTGSQGQGFQSNSNKTYSSANLAENPQYVIEDLGLERPPGAGTQHESGDTGPNNNSPGSVSTHIFRITARATGGSDNTLRVVQSTFDAQATN